MSASYNLLSGWKKLEKQNKVSREKFFAAQKTASGEVGPPLDIDRPNSKSPIVERH
jgi:hypothetical protein